jgi:predicted PurR-regulated permease PerM
VISATGRPSPDRRRQLLLWLSAAIAIVVMAIAHDVMLPFVLAMVIAYVLTPLVAAAERRKLHRGAAVVIVYLVVIGTGAGFLRAIAPRIALEFRNLRGELPALGREANETWVPAATRWMRDAGIVPVESSPTGAPEPPATGAFVARPQPDGSVAIEVGSGARVVETKTGWVIEPVRDHKGPFDANHLLADVVGRTFAYAEQNSLEVALMVRDLIATISRAIFVFFITLMLAAYMMVTRERIVDFFRSLARPAGRANFDRFLSQMDEGLSGVVRGQLVICAINGVLSAIGFAIVGLKYWPVMAIVAAVFSLVPIFGSIASAVPAVIVGLTQGIGMAAFVLAWIVGIHQLEANVLNPKIMGDAAKIHPVLVIFSLLVGEHFFHAAGALLAVPTMSIAQTLFLHLRDATEEPQ